MRLVILESPFAPVGETREEREYDAARKRAYARRCMHDCLLRGEAPYASHLLYTQEHVLDDTKPDERTLGIKAGLAWGKQAAATGVYTDLGMSNGMKLGVDAAEAAGRPIEFRKLPGWS